MFLFNDIITVTIMRIFLFRTIGNLQKEANDYGPNIRDSEESEDITHSCTIGKVVLFSRT